LIRKGKKLRDARRKKLRKGKNGGGGIGGKPNVIVIKEGIIGKSNNSATMDVSF
jgi:hypothetical protein